MRKYLRKQLLRHTKVGFFDSNLLVSQRQFPLLFMLCSYLLLKMMKYLMFRNRTIDISPCIVFIKSTGLLLSGKPLVHKAKRSKRLNMSKISLKKKLPLLIKVCNDFNKYNVTGTESYSGKGG